MRNSKPGDILVKKKTLEAGGADVHYVGKLDKNIYKCVTGDILTDKVIITDERIQHIKEHHPNDYERYSQYIKVMIETPQYILQDPVPNTAVILQEFFDKGEHFRLVIKLAVIGEKGNKENSIITFMKVSEKKFRKYLRNKKILYKSE